MATPEPSQDREPRGLRILNDGDRTFGVLSHLPTVDRALLAMAQRDDPAFLQRLTEGLGPAWRDRIPEVRPDDPELRALADTLPDDHRLTARPVRSAIDPSWFARALRDESPAVRRAVLATLDETDRAQMATDDTATHLPPSSRRQPHPEVLIWVSRFWMERLLGGPIGPARRDRTVVWLVETPTGRRDERLGKLGAAKMALAGEATDADNQLAQFEPSESERFWVIRNLSDIEAIADLSDEVVIQARLDLGRTLARVGPRPRPSALAWLTIGRLLAHLEPHDLRAVLQRHPYSVASLIRDGRDSLTNHPDPETLVRFETELFTLTGRPIETSEQADLLTP